MTDPSATSVLVLSEGSTASAIQREIATRLPSVKVVTLDASAAGSSAAAGSHHRAIVWASRAGDPVLEAVLAQSPDALLIWTSAREAPPARIALPRERLIGVGTIAASAEFRRLIAARLRIDARDVHATIVGGEGARAVPLWSSATAAGIPLHQWAVMGHGKMTVRDRIDIFVRLKESRAEAESADVAGVDDISACVDLLEAVLTDASRVLPVSGFVTGHPGIDDGWLSLPCIVNATGAEFPLMIPMNDAELAGLRHAAELGRASLER